MGVVLPGAAPEPLVAVVVRLLSSIVVGCGLVTLGAQAVATTPKFSLTEEQFDQSTFAGRFAKMLTNKQKRGTREPVCSAYGSGRCVRLYFAINFS